MLVWLAVQAPPTAENQSYVLDIAESNRASAGVSERQSVDTQGIAALSMIVSHPVVDQEPVVKFRPICPVRVLDQ